MTDPTISDALAEAYAVAPADEVVIDTLEIRHPTFVDDAGAADSIWLTTDQQDIAALIEAGAPVKAGQTVTFRSFAFRFTLGRIEPGAGAELVVRVDNIDRRIIEQLDRAVGSRTKIEICYRPYLSSILGDGPQMVPPPSFTLKECDVETGVVVGRARVAIDMLGAFPRYSYTALEYPGLIGS